MSLIRRAKADTYIREYESLSGLRKDLGITQEEIAQIQGVKQVNISNLEKRNDMLISSLHKYVIALGGELEIQIRFPDATRACLKQFLVKKGNSKYKIVRSKKGDKKETV